MNRYESRMRFEPIGIYFSHLRSSVGVRHAIMRASEDWTTECIQAVHRLPIWGYESFQSKI